MGCRHFFSRDFLYFPTIVSISVVANWQTICGRSIYASTWNIPRSHRTNSLASLKNLVFKATCQQCSWSPMTVALSPSVALECVWLRALVARTWFVWMGNFISLKRIITSFRRLFSRLRWISMTWAAVQISICLTIEFSCYLFVVCGVRLVCMLMQWMLY